jgi:hypothetical protein
MGSFLKEYWIWILAPFLLILLGVSMLILLEGDYGDGEFHYDLF